MAAESLDPCHDAYLDVAIEIGDRLRASAQPRGKGWEWVGLTPVQIPGGFRHRSEPLGGNVYSGSAGNALFFAQLFRITREPRFRDAAIAAARFAEASSGSVNPATRASFYSGWTGIVFALHDVGTLCDEPSLLRAGSRLLRRLGAIDAASQPTEVLLGIAGAIGPLLRIQECELALQYGESLLARSRMRDGARSRERSWTPFGPLSEYHRDDLTGYAHGASGIGAALLALAQGTGDARFRLAALEAFAYERRHFDAAQRNWLDLRFMPGADGDLNDGTMAQIQWCHGAAGIALARLRDAHSRDEAQIACETVAEDLARYPRNAQPNFSLCHGVAGNADVLLEAGGFEECVAAVARRGIEEFARADRSWPSALGAEEIPALLTGVAGTAYFYLRLHDPTTPSIF